MLWILIAVLGIASLGWELKRRHQPPPMDAGVFMRFALLPGESYGVLWPAAHPTGAPMMATITSRGVFALNYTIDQAPPVRLQPEGVVVTIGAHRMIAPGAAEPLVDVTVAPPGAEPLFFAIALSGARALAAWAVPSP